jgi:hypothetical protein
MSRVAAVDDKRLPNSERVEVGTKKQDHASYFCWLRDTAKRRVRDEVRSQIWIIKPSVRHCGIHQSGGQRVDANALVCVFDGCLFGQSNDGMLRGDISADPSLRDHAGNRCVFDNCAATLCSIFAISCFMHRNTPLTSTARTLSKVESSTSASGMVRGRTPALLNAQCKPP